MPNPVSEKTRHDLFHSLAAVEAAAPAILAAMSAYLARTEEEPAPFAVAATRAALLVEMLLAQAKRLAAGEEPEDVGRIGAAHRQAGIEGRHYSRFGDALIPVLKDALGPRLPVAMASAWCDAFWLVVRRLLERRAPASAPQGCAARDRELVVAAQR